MSDLRLSMNQTYKKNDKKRIKRGKKEEEEKKRERTN